MSTKPQAQTAPTTALTEKLKPLDVVSKKYNLAAIHAFGHLEQAFMVAEGIKEMRKALVPLLPEISLLMNTTLGFDTDKNPTKTKVQEPYSTEQIIDCVAEALFRGLHLAGNEFNIIVGKCYTTRNGYERLVKELPTITDLDYALSPPFAHAGHTCVKVRATWKLGGMVMGLKNTNGEPFELFAIRVNSGQGTDATIGKAQRRMFKRIYEMCTGTQFTEPNIDEEVALLPAPVSDTSGTQSEQLAEQLAEQAKRIAPEQLATVNSLKGKVSAGDFNAMLMRFGKMKADVLTRDEAATVIEEMKKLADDGVGEPA